MKRVELLQKLNAMGSVFIRPVANTIGIKTLELETCQPVPRHREIKEFLARGIIKRLSDPK